MKYFDTPHVLLEETSVVSRFVEYVQIDTASDEHSESCPSTNKQLILARKVGEELKELGLVDADVDGNGYVTATLPGRGGNDRVIGLIAHLDTSPSASGANVKPTFHENYNGSPIQLKDGVIIDPKDNPALLKCIGDTIITSDGTTLLGADDKAGIAEIMSVLEYFQANPTLPHPTIRVGFTPDEEIGRGYVKFPIKTFGAEVAFTVDGTFDGEVNIETFNADSAYVTIEGISAHPGTAKGQMVNAMLHMAKFLSLLPVELSPETTEGREGFIHPYEIEGDVATCKCHLILRDFDEDRLDDLRRIVRDVAASLIKEEPRLKIDVVIKHSYPNMFKFLKDKPEILDRLKQSVQLAGITPSVEPIRGGTDGASLTRLGLPCPNIFSGGMNFHGKTEWISTRSMGLAVCTLLNLMMLYADEDLKPQS